MNKHEIYAFLNSRGLWHEITEHKAIYNIAEAHEVPLPYPQADAVNLFVRDDKRRNYYLITARASRRVDLKAFRRTYGTRSLSFASEQELMQLLGLQAGAVTPLGLLNDTQCRVPFYLDEIFLAPPGIIGAHPNDNTATVWLKTRDLISVLEEHGTAVHVVPL